MPKLHTAPNKGVTIAAMLASLFAQMQAIGLLGIAIPLNLADQQVGVNAIGPVMALYSMGLILGAFQGKLMISRVGHIRAFAGFAALAASVAIVHSFTTNVYICGLLRLLSGVAAAVMLVVVESWLATFTHNRNRGRLLALHQITFYLAMGSGQLLINIALSSAFLIAAILSCLALMPIVLVKTESPKISLSSPMSFFELSRISPGAMIGAICAGSAIGTVFNLAPIYAKELGTSTFAVSVFMSTLVFAGILLQHPMGKLADRFNRTGVLLLLLGLTAAVSLVVMHFTASLSLPLIGLMVGSLIACLYPSSVATAYERIAPEKAVGASSALLIAYAIGGFSGPVLASSAMQHFGSDALFAYLAGVMVLGMGGIAISTCISRRIEKRRGEKRKPVTTTINGGVIRGEI